MTIYGPCTLVDSARLRPGCTVVSRFRGRGIPESANPTGFLQQGLGVNKYPAGAPAGAELRIDVTPPAAGTFTLYEDLSLSLVGAPDGVYTGIEYITLGGQADVGLYQITVGSETGPVAVTGVLVTPVTSTVNGGDTLQLNAVVVGANNPPQDVTWSAPAGQASSTGLFTLPPAAALEQVITITARSVLDPSYSGTATVRIPAVGTQPGPGPDPAPEPDPGIPDERNYAWLQAEVVDWLHRADLAAKVPKFITMAEARINRIVQARGMEIEATFAFAAGVGAVRLPTGFDTPIAAWLLDDTGRCDLSAVVPEQLPGTTQRGTPQHWAISGAYLALDCPVDVARRVTLRYRGLLRLTDAAPNNSVLSRYPDLYLYGTLMEAAMFIRDTDSLQMWAPLFDVAVKEINRNESRARAVAPLRTEIADMLGCRRN